MQTLSSPESVVLALGGIRAVGEMTGVKPSTVYNWCHRGHFPARTYRVFVSALETHGMNASPALWRQIGEAS